MRAMLFASVQRMRALAICTHSRACAPCLCGPAMNTCRSHPCFLQSPPCIIMSSDPPPRRSSRLLNKRHGTVVPDDGTESVVMTVTKRRGKRTDAGRHHTITCTFVIDVLHIMYNTVIRVITSERTVRNACVGQYAALFADVFP